MQQVNSNKKDIWIIIGKISTLAMAVYAITQIVNYFSPKSDYNIVATGQYYRHEVSISEISYFLESIRQLSDESIILGDSLIQKITEEFSSSSDKCKLYDGMWIFTLENNGKILEKVRLKFFENFPDDGLNHGYYQIEKTNPKDKPKGNFENYIDIGVIEPSDKVIIKCWPRRSPNLVDKNNYDLCQDNVFFSHLNEARVPIVYPVNVSYLHIWNKRFHNIPFLIGILTVLFLFYIGNSFRIREKLKKLKPKRGRILEIENDNSMNTCCDIKNE